MRNLLRPIGGRLVAPILTLLAMDATLVALGESYLADHLPLGVPFYAAMAAWTVLNLALVAIFGALMGKALLAQQRGLREANAQFRATTAELEVANEELEVANEELQTQAEELESSNEELVVTAEDLSRLNAELERRAEQLETARDALAHDHALLEAILGAVPTALAALGEHLQIITANAAFATLAGKPRASLIGTKLADLAKLPSLATRELAAAIEQALGGRNTVIEDLPCGADDNESETQHRCHVEVLGFRHAQEPAALLALQDVTERLRLRAREALLAALVQASGEAIVSANAAGAITSWNPAAAVLLGYSESEMLGRPLLWPVPDELNGEAAGLLSNAEEQGLVELSTHYHHASGRAVPVDLTVSAIREPGGGLAGFMAVVRDARARQLEAREQQATAEILAIFASERS